MSPVTSIVINVDRDVLNHSCSITLSRYSQSLGYLLDGPNRTAEFWINGLAKMHAQDMKNNEI